MTVDDVFLNMAIVKVLKSNRIIDKDVEIEFEEDGYKQLNEMFKLLGQDMLNELGGLCMALKKVALDEEPIVSVGEVAWFLENRLKVKFQGNINFAMMDMKWKVDIDKYN